MRNFELTSKQYAALCHYVAWVNRLAPISRFGKNEYQLEMARNGEYVWYHNRVVDSEIIMIDDMGFVGGLEVMAHPRRRMAFGMVGSEHAHVIMGMMRYFRLISQEECVAICKTFGFSCEEFC